MKSARVLPSAVYARRTFRALPALLLAVAALLAPAAPAQTCSGYIQFLTQEQVDAFNCTSFDGALRASGDRISNLRGLSGLTSISGYLDLIRLPLITSLADLSNLTHVGGDLAVRYNDALTSLAGLSSLMSVGGNFLIYGNRVMTKLDGPRALVSVGRDLSLQNNVALVSLEGLDALTRIGQDFGLNGSDVMTKLEGLETLTHIGRDLFIIGNAALVDCACGLRSLASETSPGVFAFTGVSRTVFIKDNGSLSCSPRDVLAAMPACTTNTSVEGEEMAGFALAQAQPSPTSGTATIRFSLEVPGEARLSVYDVLGREVARLVDGTLAGGRHEATLDGAALSAGLYVYRLEAGGRTLTGTLTIAR